MLLENFADLLNAKPVGPDRWIARCPCHEDKRPSLHISRGHTQPIMVRCWGCGATVGDIAQAMGLKVSDLCNDRPANGNFTRGSRRPERAPFDPVRAAESVADEAAVLALLVEKVRRGESLTANDDARLDTALRRLEIVRTWGGHEHRERKALRLNGPKVAA